MAKDNVEFEEVQGSQNPIDKYQKPLSIVGGALIVLALGYVGFTRFYLEPKQEQALASMFTAEQLFAQDSFRLALNGDFEADIMGFEEVADNYGMTDAGNLAHYYAGICNLQLGSNSKDSIKALNYYEDAVNHLKSFSSDSRMLAPLGLGACGDALCELGNYEEAASYYNKAAMADANEYTAAMYLKKAGLVYEKLGQSDKALATYTKIKDEYGSTQIGTSIDKYISRAQTQK
ncbi:MAG: tetratricopeptide repeat protein [Bacteroidia bacterium]